MANDLPGMARMRAHPAGTGLPTALVALHWSMAALIAVALGSLLLRSALPAGTLLRPWLRALHVTAGQLVFMLALVRVWVRLRATVPPMPGVPVWAARAGHAAHLFLYAVMLAQPLLGVAFLQAGGKPVAVFGWALPALVAEDTHLHFDLKALHQGIGQALYVALGLHVAAALWHHHVLRDDTLLRMLRRRREPARQQVAAATNDTAAPTPRALAQQALRDAAAAPAAAAAPSPTAARAPAADVAIEPPDRSTHA